MCSLFLGKSLSASTEKVRYAIGAFKCVIGYVATLISLERNREHTLRRMAASPPVTVTCPNKVTCSVCMVDDS